MAKMLEISKIIFKFSRESRPSDPPRGKGPNDPFSCHCCLFYHWKLLAKKTYETPAVVLSVLFVDGPTERIYIL